MENENKKEYFDINDLASVQVGLASPETIRSWSHGEVTKVFFFVFVFHFRFSSLN